MVINTKKENVSVIFRYDDAHQEVIALFPYVSYKSNRKTMFYAHIGQHGECDYDFTITGTRAATFEEYKPLLWELQAIGYECKVIKNANRKKMYKL